MNENQESQSGWNQRFSIPSLLNSGLRFFGWFVFLVVGMFFVAPEFSKTLQEFGIELPALTQLTLAFSDRLVKYWFIILPLVMAALVGQEALVLLLSRGSNRRILNIIAWLVLLIFVGLYFIAFAKPLIAIIQGLAN